MSIGPVQLIILGFRNPDFQGEIIGALEQLRKSDTVRVIDSLAVYKDSFGVVEVEHLSNLTPEEAVELGSTIGALIGLGIESAAALVLVEHQWAAPLRDAVVRAGGFRISDGFISPLDLMAVGLMSAEEAAEADELETTVYRRTTTTTGREV